ncbi:hypothetical protein HK098_001827 [Nowakowskiella sp. JEL0407]|nr:hypothetical protein HK098_001827 [Nowakowskiella sp. JEL0407]
MDAEFGRKLKSGHKSIQLAALKSLGSSLQSEAITSSAFSTLKSLLLYGLSRDSDSPTLSPHLLEYVYTLAYKLVKTNKFPLKEFLDLMVDNAASLDKSVVPITTTFIVKLIIDSGFSFTVSRHPLVLFTNACDVDWTTLHPILSEYEIQSHNLLDPFFLHVLVERNKYYYPLMQYIYEINHIALLNYAISIVQDPSTKYDILYTLRKMLNVKDGQLQLCNAILESILDKQPYSMFLSLLDCDTPTDSIFVFVIVCWLLLNSPTAKDRTILLNYIENCVYLFASKDVPVSSCLSVAVFPLIVTATESAECDVSKVLKILETIEKNNLRGEFCKFRNVDFFDSEITYSVPIFHFVSQCESLVLAHANENSDVDMFFSTIPNVSLVFLSSLLFHKRSDVRLNALKLIHQIAPSPIFPATNPKISILSLFLYLLKTDPSREIQSTLLLKSIPRICEESDTFVLSRVVTFANSLVGDMKQTVAYYSGSNYTTNSHGIAYGVRMLAKIWEIQPRIWKHLRTVMLSWSKFRFQQELNVTAQRPLKTQGEIELECVMMVSIRDALKSRPLDVGHDLLPVLVTVVGNLAFLSDATVLFALQSLILCIESGITDPRALWNVTLSTNVNEFMRTTDATKLLCEYFGLAAKLSDGTDTYATFMNEILINHLIPLTDHTPPGVCASAFEAISMYPAATILSIFPTATSLSAILLKQEVLSTTNEPEDENEQRRERIKTSLQRLVLHNEESSIFGILKVLSSVLKNEIKLMRRAVFKGIAAELGGKLEKETSGSIFSGEEEKLVVERKIIAIVNKIRKIWYEGGGTATVRSGFASICLSGFSINSISEAQKTLLASLIDLTFSDHVFQKTSGILQYQNYFIKTISYLTADNSVLKKTFQDLYERVKSATTFAAFTVSMYALVGFVSAAYGMGTNIEPEVHFVFDFCCTVLETMAMGGNSKELSLQIGSEVAGVMVISVTSIVKFLKGSDDARIQTITSLLTTLSEKLDEVADGSSGDGGEYHFLVGVGIANLLMALKELNSSGTKTVHENIWTKLSDLRRSEFIRGILVTLDLESLKEDKENVVLANCREAVKRILDGGDFVEEIEGSCWVLGAVGEEEDKETIRKLLDLAKARRDLDHILPFIFVAFARTHSTATNLISMLPSSNSAGNIPQTHQIAAFIAITMLISKRMCEFDVSSIQTILETVEKIMTGAIAANPKLKRIAGFAFSIITNSIVPETSEKSTNAHPSSASKEPKDLSRLNKQSSFLRTVFDVLCESQYEPVLDLCTQVVVSLPQHPVVDWSKVFKNIGCARSWTIALKLDSPSCVNWFLKELSKRIDEPDGLKMDGIARLLKLGGFNAVSSGDSTEDEPKRLVAESKVVEMVKKFSEQIFSSFGEEKLQTQLEFIKTMHEMITTSRETPLKIEILVLLISIYSSIPPNWDSPHSSQFYDNLVTTLSSSKLIFEQLIQKVIPIDHDFEISLKSIHTVKITAKIWNRVKRLGKRQENKAKSASSTTFLDSLSNSMQSWVWIDEVIANTTRVNSSVCGDILLLNYLAAGLESISWREKKDDRLKEELTSLIPDVMVFLRHEIGVNDTIIDGSIFTQFVVRVLDLGIVLTTKELHGGVEFIWSEVLPLVVLNSHPGSTLGGRVKYFEFETFFVHDLNGKKNSEERSQIYKRVLRLYLKCKSDKNYDDVVVESMLRVVFGMKDINICEYL